MQRLYRYIFASIAIALCLMVSASLFAQEDDQVTIGEMANVSPRHNNPDPISRAGGQAHARFGIAGIESIPNFNGHYFTTGQGTPGNSPSEWFTNTVGNPPNMPGTTTIDAPVIVVSIDLRNADGSPRFLNGHRLISDATPLIPLVLGSPVFENADYSSSQVPTQFTDAVQRAEYFGKEKDDWHTLLNASAKTPQTMTLLKGTYLFAPKLDGSCCLAVIVKFNTFVQKLLAILNQAASANEISDKDIVSFVFPDTFVLTPDGSCCIGGFHTYVFADVGNTEHRLVFDYSSWITSGFFGPQASDVTALSHEVAEIFNDPFVATDGQHNVTPWWLAPNGVCQNNLEVGDVIEGLPNAPFTITMPNGVTYHPQNEALAPWFKFESPSSAIDGAYSYPDTTVLLGLSAPQNPGCQ